MIVVDTNVIVGFSLKGPTSELARAVRRKDSHWIAPILWESEFRNAMLKLIRGSVLGHEQALGAYLMAKDAVQTLQISTAATLRLAEQHGLTAYDAEFASLAEWQDIPCVSFDDDLLKAGLAIHPQNF